MTRKSVLLTVLLLLVAAGVIMSVLTAPWFFSWAYWQEFFTFAYWQEGSESTSRSEVFRNLALAVIALGAVIVGSIRAWSAHRQAGAANEQARIAEQGHYTDRFSTAIDHLGNEQLSLRLGGIYALWRLAQDSPKRDLIRYSRSARASGPSRSPTTTARFGSRCRRRPRSGSPPSTTSIS